MFIEQQLAALQAPASGVICDNKNQWLSLASTAVDTLEGLGFARPQILAAIKETGGCTDYADLLDHLLIHTPLSDLPRVFALQIESGSGGEAVVLQAGQKTNEPTQPPKHEATTTYGTTTGITAPSRKKKESKNDMSPRLSKPNRPAAVGAKAQKSWILSNLEMDSDDSVEHDSEGCEAASKVGMTGRYSKCTVVLGVQA